MKTIKSLEDITILEVGDKVVFGNLVYEVKQNLATDGYYLSLNDVDTPNETIFKYLKLNKRTFIESIGIKACIHMDFPETKSLVALTAIVSALFKEYEKQNELPKTWEEFCEKYSTVDETEYFISSGSQITPLAKGERHRSFDKNVCASEQEAEAHLALMQLRQLRKAYVEDWEPDLTKACFGIVSSKDGINVSSLCTVYRNLSFPTYDLTEQFLTNFKNLLEIAKPLL